MDTVFRHLLILMVVVWTAAMLLRRVGLPTIFGELVAGVILGPAVLDWVHPNVTLEILAEMGIFFLMLHTGVTTEPRAFFKAVKSSLGVAIVGAVVPFAVSTGLALAFGLEWESALFVGLTLTATAVVITLKIFQDLGLQQTEVSRIVVAACMVDDLLTLLLFSLVLSMLNGEALGLAGAGWIVIKVVLFFGFVIVSGVWFYPILSIPFSTGLERDSPLCSFSASLSACWPRPSACTSSSGRTWPGCFSERKSPTRR